MNGKCYANVFKARRYASAVYAIVVSVQHEIWRERLEIAHLPTSTFINRRLIRERRSSLYASFRTPVAY